MLDGQGAQLACSRNASRALSVTCARQCLFAGATMKDVHWIEVAIVDVVGAVRGHAALHPCAMSWAHFDRLVEVALDCGTALWDVSLAVQCRTCRLVV
jgi:hypothetical protein